LITEQRKTKRKEERKGEKKEREKERRRDKCHPIPCPASTLQVNTDDDNCRVEEGKGKKALSFIRSR
jgi:hypothetical protein